MLDDFDSIDEQSLVEALSRYYFMNGSSFDGLDIKQENMALFNSVMDWALDYYNGG